MRRNREVEPQVKEVKEEKVYIVPDILVDNASKKSYKKGAYLGRVSIV